MYDYKLHQQIESELAKYSVDINGKDHQFYIRLIANASSIHSLYSEIYGHHLKTEQHFQQLISIVITAYLNRTEQLKQTDLDKIKTENWFLSNELAGMSLYVDRFCGGIKNLEEKLYYFKTLGVNVLHLMPLFESPKDESDGGYAVSDFRKVDARFGNLKDLMQLQKSMSENNMHLMIDIVLNHTSHHHEWAQKAKEGDRHYQDFFYMFDDRNIPDQYDKTMPDIFPESAPGNFTYIPECEKWVMTVFHKYQWDLNYTNPAVFIAMMDTIFFYANLGVDILRIDAPAFIWKEIGTSSQNLPQAHTLLRLIKQCVQVATPGMALLGEAIVAPREIMNYFGKGIYLAKECDFTYNATQMALQWDALATGDTKVMLAAQPILLQKPLGTSWITYTRCHDDIGLGYDDYMIAQAGYDPYRHRQFLKNYYSGNVEGSMATGALFSYNPKTGDARISGTLASLCGLEKAIEESNKEDISIAIRKILLMQSMGFFIGGLPMIFYGDEVGYTNDYSYLNDEGKSYDNRWMHRPLINWNKNELRKENGTIEQKIFSGTERLLNIRKSFRLLSDHSNLNWFSPHNVHVAGFVRSANGKKLYCVFNFSVHTAYLTWFAFKEQGANKNLYDHWSERNYTIGKDHEFLIMKPFEFFLFEDI
jgi:amylosucrase